MRRYALTAVLLGLLALGAAPAGAQQGADLVPATTAHFPERAFRLSVPEKRALTPEQLKVTENGEPISGVSLTSTSSGPQRRDFGAVLLIDASLSMRGRAITGAMQAARALAAERSGNQQLGVIAFNRQSKLLIAPTSDQTALEAALAGLPPLQPQTRIFDAVNAAMDQLEQAEIAAGSIVVLSDGRDSGSVMSAKAVATRARKSNVRIYTVGLRSRSFDRSELQGLADAGHGRYLSAGSVAGLGRIFRELGAQLASEYLIRYRSSTSPGRDVIVAARVDGVEGVATSTYRVPGGSSFVLVKHSFWTSTLGLAVTAGVFALLVALSLWLTLSRNRRKTGVTDRVRGFVSMPGERMARPELVQSARAVPGAAERSLEKTKWWPAFKEDVEIARIEAEAIKIAVWTALGTLVALYLFTRLGGLLIGLFVAIAVPLSVRAYVRFKLDKQRQLFADQLADILQGSASAIRAGHGLTAALAMTVESAPEPSNSEFRRVVTDEQLGVPLDEALRVVQRRMDSRDVQQIALVAQIQRDTGGNTAEVLDRVTDALRRRDELRRMVRALTAQGRLSRWVVTFLPVVLLAIIAILNPGYISPLFTEPFGRIMLIVAALMMIAGSLVIKKIVDFKV